MLENRGAAESLRSSLFSSSLHDLISLFFSLFFNLFSAVCSVTPANMYMQIWMSPSKLQGLTSCLSFYSSGHLPSCVLQASVPCALSLQDATFVQAQVPSIACWCVYILFLPHLYNLLLFSPLCFDSADVLKIIFSKLTLLIHRHVLVRVCNRTIYIF